MPTVDVLASLVDAGRLPRPRQSWLSTQPAAEPWAQ